MGCKLPRELIKEERRLTWRIKIREEQHRMGWNKTIMKIALKYNMSMVFISKLFHVYSLYG